MAVVWHGERLAIVEPSFPTARETARKLLRSAGSIDVLGAIPEHVHTLLQQDGTVAVSSRFAPLGLGLFRVYEPDRDTRPLGEEGVLVAAQDRTRRLVVPTFFQSPPEAEAFIEDARSRLADPPSFLQFYAQDRRGLPSDEHPRDCSVAHVRRAVRALTEATPLDRLIASMQAEADPGASALPSYPAIESFDWSGLPDL